MGGEAKMTDMILKVDLQCERCYKKVKKILCKFPQIRDQIFDEKGDKVMIKVWCCSPEKIRDKLCCKGGGTIKSIEIVEPPTPPVKKVRFMDLPKPKASEPPPKAPEPAPKPAENPPKAVEQVQVFAIRFPPMCPPVGHCCMECYHGRGGGPCWHGCGTPPPPPPGCGYGRPVYYDVCVGMNWGNYKSPCTYFCEENPSACTVM